MKLPSCSLATILPNLLSNLKSCSKKVRAVSFGSRTLRLSRQCLHQLYPIRNIIVKELGEIKQATYPDNEYQSGLEEVWVGFCAESFGRVLKTLRQ